MYTKCHKTSKRNTNLNANSSYTNRRILLSKKMWTFSILFEKIWERTWLMLKPDKLKELSFNFRSTKCNVWKRAVLGESIFEFQLGPRHTLFVAWFSHLTWKRNEMHRTGSNILNFGLIKTNWQHNVQSKYTVDLLHKLTFDTNALSRCVL